MNTKSSFLLSLTALACCVASAGAQDFSFAGFGGGSNRVATLNEDSTMRAPRRQTSSVVNKLPQDYFGSATAPTSEPEPEISTSQTANLLVIAALATMLCIGMTITGLCIMRRRPPSTPAQVLALRQRQLGIT